MRRLSERERLVVAGVAVAVSAFALGALTFRGHGVGHEHGEHGAGAGGGEHGAGAGGAGHGEHGERAEVWTCAMHPQIRQPAPGTCPLCGMDLIPVQSDGAAAGPDRIVLSERAVALSRLRTIEVRRQAEPGAEVRLLGRVEPDETTLRTVTAWVAGRIDRLHVSATGVKVRSGQVIATLYSPEVLAAHRDLVVAKRQVDRMQSATPAARAAAEAALEATKDRLRLLGVGDAQLARMESEGQPARQVAIHSPFAGTVIERLATEGAYVSTGAPLYRIADLSRLWVQLDAYERHLPGLRVGQAARITVDSLPDESFEGRVAFIDPIVDPSRRTARVRVEVRSRDQRLRPGMFAQAVVAGQVSDGQPRPLMVPTTAALFTGLRALVYVEVPGAERPTYEARVVRLGPRAGEGYPVVAGLSEGERVVTRGAFVLDADLQIRGGNSMMSTPDDDEPGPWDEVLALPPAERAKLGPAVEAYLAVQRALAEDDHPSASAAAEALSRATAEAQLTRPPAAREMWQAAQPRLRAAAERVAGAASIEEARGGFEELTAQLLLVLRRFGNPIERPLQVAFCPMALGSQGATWVQEGTEVDNAYFGDTMRTCRELRETLAAGAHLAAPTGRDAQGGRGGRPTGGDGRSAGRGGHAH